MKFESVRLLHAQAVPDHYIANQVYQPIDEDHRQHGSFVILFDNFNTPDGAFIASLVNTLIREYYRNTSVDRLSCFEQTLVRMNEQIKQFSTQRDVSTPLQLNGAIVLCLENEIHITYIGQPFAFLFRQNEIISLIEPSEMSSETVQTFSLITSGEVYDNDTLVLISSINDGLAVKEDLRFSIKHTPLNESGRAFARILKQKLDLPSEAIFIRFNPEDDSTYQVYLDRPLETTSEKMEQYRKNLKKHSSFITDGVGFLGGQLAKRKTSPKNQKTVASSDVNSAPEAVETEETHLSKEEDHPPLSTTIPEGAPYQVKMYRDKKSAPSPQPVETVTSDYTIAVPAKTKSFFTIKPRTIYLLIGLIILLAVIIRIVNATALQHTGTENVTINREAILAQVETAERNADAAKIQNDSITAITELLSAQELLAQIPEDFQNETSKSYRSRIQESLDSLTRTVYLTEDASQSNLLALPQKIIATKNGSYIIYADGAMEKVVSNGKSIVKNIPASLSIIDGTSYDDSSRIVLLMTDKSNEVSWELYSLDTSTEEVTKLSRADGKPWPRARLITSFETNLYLIDEKMWKATLREGKYRVIPYATQSTTTALSSITINDGFFYAIEPSEGGDQLVRIDAKSPKTPIKFFDIPEEFMPQTISRIMSIKSGVIHLLDTEKNRIIEVTTDGAYKKQMVLPSDLVVRDCNITETHAVCATNDKKFFSYKIN